MELWVTEGNVTAVDLYRKAGFTEGFTETGRRDQLASNPRLQIIEMARAR